MSGWAIRIHPNGQESYVYRCTGRCHVTYIFAPEDKDPKAWCCGQTVALPKLNWLESFPREQAPRYRGTLLTLHHPER